MSPREKKLLILLLAGGFVMLNLIGLSFYRSQRAAVDERILQAERELATAELFQASRNQVGEEMEWLEQHLPEPAANQDVQVVLQTLCKVEAENVGLEIKRQDLLPSITDEGLHFHRARIAVEVSGTEQALYEWFDRLNVPAKLRGATRIILTPNSEDDTQINCKATIEQWFVPPPSA